VGLWSLLRGFGRRSSPAVSRRKSRVDQSADKLVRRCRFEAMEERRMMDADPIKVGVTYLEEDSGSDLHGDSFEILFQGGAPNTELTRLVIDGDKGAPGLSVGDMIFDTIKGGLGADEAFNLQIVSSTGIQEVTWEVIDGGSKLVFNFKGFHAGEKLVFIVDVDEVQDFDPNQTNQQLINEGIDPIASGVEFQGSMLTADFKAPHYFDTSGTGEFRNIYDPLFSGSSLLKSQGNANGLPHDDFEGKRDRSTGVMVNLTQQIKPASIRGRVHLTDREGNCFSEEALNRPLENVKVTLKDEFGNVIGVDFTNANGEYAFENLLPGTYTIIEETPPGLIDGGDHIGTIAGVKVGVKGALTTTSASMSRRRSPASSITIWITTAFAIRTKRQFPAPRSFCSMPPARKSPRPRPTASVSINSPAFQPATTPSSSCSPAAGSTARTLPARLPASSSAAP